MKEIIVKRELPSKEIKNIRNLIVVTAMDIDRASGKRLKLSDLDCSKESLDRIIFDRSIYNDKCIFHELFRLKLRIDFDGVSFDGANISGADFTGSKGVRINPQTLCDKNLSGKYTDVEFIGPFNNVDIANANFTGSKGARINPQTIRNKNLWGAVCSGVEFTGSFDNVKMNDETLLDGSNARYIDSYERVKESIKKLIK